jgi:hypothetical protein
MTDKKQPTKTRFSNDQLNEKCRNLENNGFEEYLNVKEEDAQHIIYTNTKPKSEYNRWVCDIYVYADTFTIEYSKQ